MGRVSNLLWFDLAHFGVHRLNVESIACRLERRSALPPCSILRGLTKVALFLRVNRASSRALAGQSSRSIAVLRYARASP